MGTWADTKGPTPGPKGVLKQHSAMASGYEIPKPEQRVDTRQKDGETGCTEAPGLTTRAKRGAKQ